MESLLPVIKKQKVSNRKSSLPPSSCQASSDNKNNNISKLSKNMEYIVQQEIIARGLNTELLKSNEFSHIIIKAVQDDEKMYLMAMTKRLQQCCPFLDE